VVAGPGPLKYSPETSTVLMFQPRPPGTTKSSASSSSKLFIDASKFWELEDRAAGLLYWS
jgi:hypothetical protein